MDKAPSSVAVALALVLLAAFPAGAKPTPTPEPGGKKVDKPRREDRPSCADLHVSAEEMRAALERHHAKTGDELSGRGAFDAIGDELECRWPEPGENGSGLVELLERGGNVPGGGSIPSKGGAEHSGGMR